MNKHEFTEKQRENRMEDKKALKKFLPILLLCFLVGVVCGISGVLLGKTADAAFWDSVIRFVKWFAVYGVFFVNGGLVAAGVVLLRKCRWEYSAWDEENEEALKKIQVKLGYVKWFSGLAMYLTYFFFAAGLWAVDLNNVTAGSRDILMSELAVVFAGMIGFMVVVCILQQRGINLEKEINPEKMGSIYDTKFTTKWLDTSDEAEKYTTYKCAYRSYRVVNRVTSILWLVCLIGQMLFQTGVFATLVTSIILIVQTSAYNRRAIYYEKKPSEVMK